MSSASKKLMGTTAAGGEALAIEDVFSTYLYTGNDSTQTITNGIDLAGEGGLVWIKGRSSAKNNALYDTERGVNQYLYSNSTLASTSGTNMVTAFNSDGFSIGSNGLVNEGPITYASWTFRKAPRFFDVVTYTGNGNNTQQVSHNLDVAPGAVFIKRTDSSSNWVAYTNYSGDYIFNLNNTNSRIAAATATMLLTSTTFTATTGETDALNNTNISGATYVAYLFAHDPLGPSGDGSDGLIACGSYTGNGSTDGPEIDLGWEPQWVLLKDASAGSNWLMYDVMRGLTVGTANAGPDQLLQPHTSNAEYTDFHLSPNATGFKVRDTGGDTNNSGQTYIYIAIRRGPMRAPTSGTEVFAPVADTGDKFITSGFPVDMVLAQPRSSGGNTTFDRMRGATSNLRTYSTAAEASASGGFETWFDYQNGIDYNWYGSGTNLAYHMFRRAPEFFDAVAYSGDGVAGRTVPHNLGVAPEMMIFKVRDSSFSWGVSVPALGANPSLLLNATLAAFSSEIYTSAQSATTITLTNESKSNANGNKFIAYLFATLPGVSKVGSYTGSFPTSTTQTIDCGFTTSARFVLIKAASRSGAWAVWDSARGITVSDDPRLELNNTNAEQTQSNIDVEPHSSGFIIDSSSGEFNEEGETYIFYAIA